MFDITGMVRMFTGTSKKQFQPRWVRIGNPTVRRTKNGDPYAVYAAYDTRQASSKYTPHQGKRECARRRGDLRQAKALAVIAGA